MRLVTFACAALALFALPARAQDPVKVASDTYKVIAENDRVRVLRAAVAPGAKTVMHAHPAHLVISLGAANVKFTTGDGTDPVDVVIVEMKGEPGATSLPPTRPGLKTTVLLDNARVRAVRASFEPTFHEPAGSTHDYDQVVVMLAPADVALTLEGKTVSSWKRGDVRLIGRGVAHETHAGKLAGDVLIIAVK